MTHSVRDSAALDFSFFRRKIVRAVSSERKIQWENREIKCDSSAVSRPPSVTAEKQYPLRFETHLTPPRDTHRSDTYIRVFCISRRYFIFQRENSSATHFHFSRSDVVNGCSRKVAVREL